MTTILIPRRETQKGTLRRLFSRAPSRHSVKAGPVHVFVLLLVFVSGLGVVTADATGNRLLFMSTASMCPKVCVGALVIDRPLTGSLHTGEIVTFHLPGKDDETYTHEIYSVSSEGAIETLGIANHRPDPWNIQRSDIVGRTVLVVPGLGWLLRALPFLAIAVLVWVEGRSWIKRRFLHSWDTLWQTLLIVVPVLLLRPLLRATLVSIGSDPRHKDWFSAVLINTGLLPASFSAKVGPVSKASPGETAHVFGDGKGRVIVNEVVSLRWWGWLALSLVVLSPLLRYAWVEWRYKRASVDDTAEVVEPAELAEPAEPAEFAIL
jgi:hypothetical protein